MSHEPASQYQISPRRRAPSCRAPRRVRRPGTRPRSARSRCPSGGPLPTKCPTPTAGRPCSSRCRGRAIPEPPANAIPSTAGSVHHVQTLRGAARPHRSCRRATRFRGWTTASSVAVPLPPTPPDPCPGPGSAPVPRRSRGSIFTTSSCHVEVIHTLPSSSRVMPLECPVAVWNSCSTAPLPQSSRYAFRLTWSMHHSPSSAACRPLGCGPGALNRFSTAAVYRSVTLTRARRVRPVPCVPFAPP